MASAMPSAPKMHLDYRRFELAAAAALDDDDDDPELRATESGEKDLEAYKIAHRIAGVIEDVRSIGGKGRESGGSTGSVPLDTNKSAVSERNGGRDHYSAESASDTKTGRAHAKDTIVTASRDITRVRSMYNLDYSRFTKVIDEEEDDEDELCEDGIFSKKTIKALEACEARLAEAARSNGNPDENLTLNTARFNAMTLDAMD